MVRENGLLSMIAAHAESMPHHPALCYEQQTLSYQQLAQQIKRQRERLLAHSLRHQTCALLFAPTIDAVVCYLACLDAQVPLLLLAPDIDAESLQHYVARFQLACVFDQRGQWQMMARRAEPVRRDLAVLLTTSGSTGSPKCVMLSERNLSANARSICHYLPMQTTDIAITSLPLNYSYGLSLLNSHLWLGASVVLTPTDMLSKAFWQLMQVHRVTSLAGVPFSYQMLRTLRLERMELPALRYLTQAGGRLPLPLSQHFAELARQKNWLFYQMYGQTEATARIAYLPPDALPEYGDCIGIAIPDGQLWLRDLETGMALQQNGVTGELIYCGPNVMLGYAVSEDDLRGDGALSELATGDLAERLENGFYRITGRKRRFVKLHGKRWSLDHLEQQLIQRLDIHTMVCGRDERLLVACETEQQAAQIATALKQHWLLHPSLFNTLVLAPLPRLANGKNDYAAIMAHARELGYVE